MIRPRPRCAAAVGRPRLRAALGVLLAAVVSVQAAGTAPASPAAEAVAGARSGARTAAAPLPADTPPAPPGQATFGLGPATNGVQDSRPYLSYTVTPGAAVQDNVVVANYSDTPETFDVYPADAFNSPDDGGFDVAAAGQPSVDLGRWITLDQKTVTVPPRGHSLVHVTMRIPANATPGDHAAGIIVSLASTTTDAKGNRIALNERTGTRVYLRVSGPLRPRLAVEGMSMVYHGTLDPFGYGSVTATFTVRNTGNVRLGASQSLLVRNVFGSSIPAKGLKDLPELLPGNEVHVTTTVQGVFPAFRTTATISVNPKSLPGDIDPAVPGISSSTSFWTVPWTLLGLLVLIVVAIVLLFRRARRRRRAAPLGNGSPAPPAMAPAGAAAKTSGRAGTAAGRKATANAAAHQAGPGRDGTGTAPETTG